MPRGAKMIYPKRVHVIIGKPMAPPALSETGRLSRREVKNTTELLREEIQKLFDLAQIKAGTPNLRDNEDQPENPEGN